MLSYLPLPPQGTCLRRMWKGFCREQQTETTPAGSHGGKTVPVHFWGLWKEILPRLQPEDTRAHTHGRPALRLPLWGSHQIESSFLMLIFCRVATRSLRSLQTWSRTYWRTRSRNLVAALSPPRIQSLAAILTLTHTGAHHLQHPLLRVWQTKVLSIIVQGDFFTGTPSKNSKYKKLI